MNSKAKLMAQHLSRWSHQLNIISMSTDIFTRQIRTHMNWWRKRDVNNDYTTDSALLFSTINADNGHYKNCPRQPTNVPPMRDIHVLYFWLFYSDEF